MAALEPRSIGRSWRRSWVLPGISVSTSPWSQATCSTSPPRHPRTNRSSIRRCSTSPKSARSWWWGAITTAARLEAVKPLLDLGRITVVARPTRPADGGVAVFDSLGLKIACLPFVSQRGIVKAAEIMDLDPDQHAQGYEARLRRIIAGLTDDMGTDTVNVVTAHLTVYGAEIGGGEREAHIFGYAIPPQAFPGSLSYVALGHLHRQQRIPASAPVWYSGSPMQLDFGEVSDAKGVLVVEAEAGKPASVAEVAVRGGTKLVQVRGTLEQVLCPLRIWRGAM